MGNEHSRMFPYAPLGPVNTSLKVYTAAELRALGDNHEYFAELLRVAGNDVLGTEVAPPEVNQRTVPFCAVDGNNEFAQALMSPVPDDIYRRENVWWVENGQVCFHPWIFRLAYPKAINRYKSYYDRVNRARSAPFPKEQFMEALRKIKSRGYQRKHRAKKRMHNPTEDHPPQELLEQ